MGQRERERVKGNYGTKRKKDECLKQTIMKKVHKRRWKETEKDIKEVNGCVCERERKRERERQKERWRHNANESLKKI